MEKGDAVPVRDSREEDAARTRRLALALLLRLAAAAAALAVLLGVVLLVTQAEGPGDRICSPP